MRLRRDDDPALVPPVVAVFASSSEEVDAHYRELADELGTRLGARNWTVLYGGTLTGMMRSLADSCRAVGGTVVAVTLRRFVDLGIHDVDADELVVTEDLAERKAVMLGRADAVVVLPGGFGTLDEAVEVLAMRRIGVLDLPLVFLDHGGFWSPLLAQVEVMARERMLSSGEGAAPPDLGYQVAADPAAVETTLAHQFAGE